MDVEVKVPEVGESVQEAVLAQWYKRDGEEVRKDEILFVIETDKVTLEVTAQADGVLRIRVPEGKTVAVGTVVGVIETGAVSVRREEGKPPGETRTEPAQEAKGTEGFQEHVRRVTPTYVTGVSEEREPAPTAETGEQPPVLSPSVRRLVAEKKLDVSRIAGTGPGGRVTKGDVLEYLEKVPAWSTPKLEAREPAASRKADGRRTVSPEAAVGGGGEAPEVLPSEEMAGEPTTRKPMSPIRRRIAERLLEARHNTAMLTTFNEIDMSGVQAERARFKETFRDRHGVSLGIMSFFIKAAVEALKEFPEVNAMIDGKDIVYHHYYHIGVAVGGERGLVVPVVRHADRLTFAELEQAISHFVGKVKENRLELTDMEGGTFTISNGGVYGSLLSTPILNTPQSGILGMHKIEDRPVVVDGQIVIRPMMYVALSYDHRIIDGREAVGFLKRIKECVENPERIMLEI